MKLALSFLVTFGFYSATLEAAEKKSAKEGAKVFIIESKEKPVKVLPATKASEGQGVMMRMPNLDASTVVAVPDSQSKNNSEVSSRPKPRRAQTSNNIRKNTEASTLRFTRAKIQGALRMPRVKFTKVAPSVDIREEIPDLDFTSKSLTDSGF